MNIAIQTLEAQADLLVEEALQELGVFPLDEPDDYTMQCDYAGCYPWLVDMIKAHSHDDVVRSVSYNDDGEIGNTIC